MKLNNFLVGSFLIGIDLVIGFQLQSAITQILESFLNTNTTNRKLVKINYINDCYFGHLNEKGH